MITIKINEIEMTTEEAKELYKQLGELFEPNLASLPPTMFRDPLGQAHFINPKDLTQTTEYRG